VLEASSSCSSGVRANRLAGLVKGWAPTLIGYSAQGFCKFGFYEIFKDVYANLAGKDNYYSYRGAVCVSFSTFSVSHVSRSG
jgi:solute carrier family 25 phosphate transporter 3